MKYGMTQEQFELLNTLLVKPLKDHGAEVYIFGSRVTKKHHPFSDVDILFRIPSNVQIPSRIITSIKEVIEESRFPFSVDLVEESDLVQSYRDHVLSTMQKL